MKNQVFWSESANLSQDVIENLLKFLAINSDVLISILFYNAHSYIRRQMT